MLDPRSWLPQAQELALGQRRYCAHDCGGGKTLIVGCTDEGWNAYCFRCSEKGFVPAPAPSLAERLARLKEKDAVDAAATADTRPPTPANADPSTWPLHAKVWLYGAGVSNDRIREHGIYYHERLDRVVLPVFDGPKLAYWQARGFDKGRPKYLNPPVDKSGLFARFGSGGPLVLTEDILSAIRVGEVAESWAILGTALSDAQTRAIVERVRPVVIWLDGDRAGRRARARLFRLLTMAGAAAHLVKTDLDPKLHSREQITEILRPWLSTEEPQSA